MKNFMEKLDYWWYKNKEWILYICVAIGIFLILTVYCHIRCVWSDQQYNNGICECDGKLNFSDYDRGVYIFQCENCKNLVQTYYDVTN